MRAFLAGTAFVFAFGVVLAVPGRPCKLYRPPTTRVDQGCINQGNDRRVAAALVCGLQQELSWKSEDRPKLVKFGRRAGTHIQMGWPPYLVFNAPASNGNWRMFRVGFRYDRTWRGYIFPTAACKCLQSPLDY
jgi:hypothetical protein